MRRLAIIAVVALALTAAGLWNRSLTHRSAIDPSEPVYTSNYIATRGLPFPWLIAADAFPTPVPVTRRILWFGLAKAYFFWFPMLMLADRTIRRIQRR